MFSQNNPVVIGFGWFENIKNMQKQPRFARLSYNNEIIIKETQDKYRILSLNRKELDFVAKLTEKKLGNWSLCEPVMRRICKLIGI